MRVLIVDDAMFMRKTVRKMLEDNGFEVAGEACNGLEAVKMYQELKPDLVTMDITMPEVDGIASLKMIRKLDPQARVVMMSAMGQASLVTEAIVNGARTFIVKPFQEQHVVDTLRSIQ
ncbi:MAG: response regulator [Syntrophomonadaceae bacterium]|nr:response regulator [Syntrophomonadaceae bacterium]